MKASPHYYSHKARKRFGGIGLLAAVISGIALPYAGPAQTPLYQWDFNAGTGAPAVSAGGGTLTPTTSGAGTVSFALGGGVSGGANDGALATVTSTYNNGASAAVASTAAGEVLTGVGTLSQFTLTMWVKGDTDIGGQQFARLFSAGTSATVDNNGNPGFGLLLGGSATALQVTVNGFTLSVTLGTPLSTTGWNFIAAVYDGAATNPYFTTAMFNAVGTNNNMAILLGGVGSSVALAGSGGINTGGPLFSTSPGAAALGSSAYAAMANRSNLQRGFDGTIDDVRLYNTLLTTSQLETVRLGAIPEPASATLLLLGAIGLKPLRRRQAS